MGKSYRYFGSQTGRSDRLLIVFDSDRLQVRGFRELFSHKEYRLNDWRHRSPLAARRINSAVSGSCGSTTGRPSSYY